MSKQPLGKTLLRNVIRHTDAHNKIQEEIDMWKMRDWEIQTSQRKDFSDAEGHMHCDRVSDQRRDFNRSRERASEHDDREARYWTRKLYEFESNDPDRWGHSGFKELYPEEFESDGAKKKMSHHKMKKSKSDTEACLSKRSKKSSRKKKKKKKKGEDGKRKKVDSSSSDYSSDDSGATKDKQKRKRTKSRHKNKKASKARGKDVDISTEDSNDEIKRERLSHSRKKRKHDSHKDSDSGPNSKKKKRKNWKATGEESSDSSAD
uniref:NKAP domain containing 1 n=1 Tax=Neolamprologus brichardi TaxID=32507 RepID=A0A3Q4I188_NEOBR